MHFIKNKTTKSKYLLLVVLFFALFLQKKVLALDYTSSSFIVRDPVISPGAGYATSSNFRYFSSTGQTVIGESSGGGFIERSGFLYFSAVTNPVVSATSGSGQVSLTWTASVASLGYTVDSYEVGVSTTSGSGYIFTNVGNVLSYTSTGLSNGTTYYFIVRALDSLGDVIATSGEVSSTPTAPSGGGGGGGGSTSSSVTGVFFSGYAFPLSKVVIMKDGIVVLETIAGGDARFSVRLSNISSGSHNFSVYSTDIDGIKSKSFSFPITISEDDSVTVSGIFIAPTIEVDKAQVKKGDDIKIFGQTTPESDVTIQVNSETQVFVEAVSNDDGVYLYDFNTAPLEMGDHSTTSKTQLENGQSSGYGKEVAFIVGTQNIPKEPGDGSCRADLNSDSKVNLVDFSIAAFWYNKTLSTEMTTKENDCLNKDGKINLVDFSIMAYYWTG